MAGNASYGEWVGEGRNKKYVASIKRMYIFIYECSITEVTDIDVIACPTNGNMGFGAGLAKHIAAKAGSAMTDECRQYVDENGPLELTQNFSSAPGNLPFKANIHAVGPSWTDYVGRPVKCARDLCNTVINILMIVRAEGWTRVAIPAISSGVSGMPKQLCAEMYIKAFADFAESGPEGLKEVHFVDTNSAMVDLVCKAYDKWVNNPSSITEENARKYPAPQKSSAGTLQAPDNLHNLHGYVSDKESSSPQELQFAVKHSHMKHHHRRHARSKGVFSGFGDEATYEFKVSGLQVKVYKCSLTKIKGMDAITNSTVNTLEHGCGVALQISQAAGSDMVQDCKDYIRQHGNVKVTNNFVSLPGRLSCSGIIHAVGPQWSWYDGKRSQCAKDLYQTVVNVLVTVKQRNWSTVAMSAISASHSGVPKQLCTEMIVKAISEFAERGPGSVQEVHFIDTDQEILKLIADAHKDWVNDPKSLSFDNANSYS